MRSAKHCSQGGETFNILLFKQKKKKNSNSKVQLNSQDSIKRTRVDRFILTCQLQISTTVHQINCKLHKYETREKKKGRNGKTKD